MNDAPDLSLLHQANVLPKFMDRSGAQKPMTPEQMKAKAQEYEAQVLSSMLNSISKTVDTQDSEFNGGDAEETWRGMLNEEYGKIIAKSGGIGLADSVVHELVRMQANTSKGQTQ